jgi:CBS domain-containing protein
MNKFHIRHVPVTNGTSVVGVLTIRDVMNR